MLFHKPWNYTLHIRKPPYWSTKPCLFKFVELKCSPTLTDGHLHCAIGVVGHRVSFLCRPCLVRPSSPSVEQSRVYRSPAARLAVTSSHRRGPLQTGKPIIMTLLNKHKRLLASKNKNTTWLYNTWLLTSGRVDTDSLCGIERLWARGVATARHSWKIRHAQLGVVQSIKTYVCRWSNNAQWWHQLQAQNTATLCMTISFYSFCKCSHCISMHILFDFSRIKQAAKSTDLVSNTLAIDPQKDHFTCVDGIWFVRTWAWPSSVWATWTTRYVTVKTISKELNRKAFICTCMTIYCIWHEMGFLHINNI